MNLKKILFVRTNEEKEEYLHMLHAGSKEYTREEIKRQLSRFQSDFQIIEEAGLESEFEKWQKQMALNHLLNSHQQIHSYHSK